MHILFTNIHTPNLYKVKGRCNKFGYNVWTKTYIHTFIPTYFQCAPIR